MLDQLDRQERPALVRFELRPVEDKQASLQAGRTVCKDIEYALITPPYSKDEVVQKVPTWLKNLETNVRTGRTPEKWAENWKRQLEDWRAGNETPLDGFDIRNWSAISPAEIKNCLSAGCRTIEDLAAVNDEGLRRIGMGGHALKRKANTYLQTAKDHGPVVMRNDALERENEQLKGTIESLQAQLNKLSQNVQNLQSARMDYSEEPEDNSININDVLVDDDNNANDDLQAARELFVERFGKNPHPLMKYDTIMRKLNQ